MPYTSLSQWIGLIMLISPLSLLATSANDFPATNYESENCTAPPIIYCPSFVWLKPSESAHPNRTGYAQADPGGPNCEAPIVSYTDEIFIINACHKVYTRIWTATDPNNPSLIDTCHQTIKQVDEEAPVIENVPDDLIIYTDNMDPNTINCSTRVSWIPPLPYDNHLLSSFTFTAKKNGVELNLRSGDNFMDGVTTITYTAFDYCGNFSTASFDINVMCADCHLDCPEDVCLPLDSDTSPQSTGTATAYNGNTNCGTVSTYYLDELIETGCNGKSKTIRTWYGVFANMPQNTSSCTQTIELKDLSAVVLHNCPDDINVVDNFTKAHWAPPVAVASDNANVITTTSNFSPGNFFPIGITTVIYTAVDACGNEATCSFKVSVLNDATYENCPADIEVTCSPGGTATVSWDEPVYQGSCSTCKRGAPIYGFMYMGSFNGSNYYCSTSNYTYADAKDLVKKHGGHIASINSAEENDYLSKRIISSTAMIGYTDIVHEGQFVWEDGSTPTYNNWFHMQPNNQDNQDVVELMKSSGLWNDVENDKKLEVIMEFPCEYVKQIEGPRPGQELNSGTYTVEYHISDGCGLSQFCKFDITVRAGISMLCQDDIYTEVPTSATEVSVSWDAPQAFSCCASCNDLSCITVEQIEGPPSGSNFYRQSKTQITYRATDPCGNSVVCSFFILVDIDETSGKVISDTDLYAPAMETLETSEEGAPTSGEILIAEKENTVSEFLKEEEKDVKKALVIAGEKTPLTSDKFYPNPMLDVLNLELSDYTTVNALTIFDYNGRMVLHNAASFGNTTTIDVSKLNAGIYILQIQNKDTSISTHKLVKL